MRYRPQPPLSPHPFHCVIGVTVNTSVFQTENAGATPCAIARMNRRGAVGAWRREPQHRHGAPFSQSSQSVRVVHAVLRRPRLKVQVLVGAPLLSIPIPPWRRSVTHFFRKEDHAGAAPAGGSISQLPRSSTAEHPPLKRTVDGANPSRATPFFTEAKAD